MRQRKIAILKDTDNWLKVFTPFRNDFVEALKVNIPSRDKEPVRNKEGRFEYWRIREQYLNDIIELINDFFPGSEIESDLVEEDVDWVSAVFDAVQVAWKSFKQVLQKHLAGWHLGILLFGTYEGDGVQWHLPPTSTVELDALREPEAQDETPMLPALRMAWEWLRRRAEGGRIILLTDGLPNRGGYQEEILDEAPKHSVPIDCIGFKSMDFAGYDKDFLRKLSSATGGIFTEAERAEELLAGVLRRSAGTPWGRGVISSEGGRRP